MSTDSMNEASHARWADLEIAEKVVEQAKGDGGRTGLAEWVDDRIVRDSHRSRY